MQKSLLIFVLPQELHSRVFYNTSANPEQLLLAKICVLHLRYLPMLFPQA
jgi:hypothetical protein